MTTTTTHDDLEALLGPALASAVAAKGYSSLTPVQHAVLAPRAAGRDLRISSQTGSGKTVALGLAIRDRLERVPGGRGPAALVIAPTRELARQVQSELSWLFAEVGAKVASLTGGASYRDEHRALAASPAIVVGTPGRLLDHVEQGSLDLGAVRAVVLDEADRMLDLGFREPIESILARTPDDRRTHLVSATFAADVLRLADRVQRDAMHVEGTRLGTANDDIAHVAHVVAPHDRFDAIVNLLLAHDEKALLFVRTRADVAQLASDLEEAGFAVAPLSGEMEQRERTRALGAFARGAIRVLVATDVAARGLDVPDVGLVIHVDAPTDPDAYTHRSGRTGRAGRKGTSALVLTPREVALARRVIGRAGIRVRFEPLPEADAILHAQTERRVAALTGDESALAIDDATLALARQLARRDDVERTIARLLARDPDARAPRPRDVRALDPRPVRPGFDPRASERGFARAPRERLPRERHPQHGAAPARPDRDRPFAVFHVTWGERQGADPRRVLAMICRRGRVASHEVGAIRVGPDGSDVQIALEAADRFATATRRRDPRDPSIAIHPA